MDEIFPYEVKAGKGYDGQIASLHISPEPLDHGATPKISWTIHFEGTTEAKSKDGTLKRIEVNKNCTITLSTTDWGCKYCDSTAAVTQRSDLLFSSFPPFP
jgi:hypothetical protein